MNKKTLKTSSGNTYEWDKNITYIKNLPFMHSKSVSPQRYKRYKNIFISWDLINTDRISPADSMVILSPAGLNILILDLCPLFASHIIKYL